MVNLTVKAKHCRFIYECISQVIASEFMLMRREIEAKCPMAALDEDDVTLTVSSTDFCKIYQMLSTFEEGKTAAFNRLLEDMVLPQLAADAGNPEVQEIINFVQEWKAANAAWLSAKINRGKDLIG